MQLDIFGATEVSATGTGSAPVVSGGSWKPPETVAFEAALRRGALGDAVAILNRLQTLVASRVLLAAGFAVASTNNRRKLMEDVQSEIVMAARMGLSGHELRRSKDVGQASNVSGTFIHVDKVSDNVLGKEKSNDVRTNAESRGLSEGRSLEGRGDGINSGVGSQSLDAGLAGTRSTVVGGGDVPELLASSGGDREGRSGRGSELESSISARDLAVERDQRGSADVGSRDGVAPSGFLSAKFDSDVPSEFWLSEKREESARSGKNEFGVPNRMGPITGSFSRSLNLSLSRLATLPGERGEQSSPRASSLEYIREHWDTVSQEAIYVEVDPEGNAWVSEGNHRVMVGLEMGVESLPVKVRYFSGGERFDTLFAPEKLIADDAKNVAQSFAAKAVSPLIAETQERVDLDSPAGGKISVVKTKYIENEWGVSWASTNVASVSSKEIGIEVANFVIKSGAQSISDMRNAAQDALASLAKVEDKGVVEDYVLTDADRIGLGGLAEKFNDNLQAIRIVKALDVEKRNATADERRALVRYVGWGGLKGVFDPNNKQWARQHVALKSLLSDKEWAAASRSQLDAFYTPPVVAQSMFSAASRLGFTKGRVLEPSVGVGNFFGLMPEEMRQGSTLHGVELDVLTSGIVAALYPNAKIAKETGFQDYQVPAGYYDMVTGNPPFGSQAVSDDSGAVYSGWSVHNYFFAKSIEMLRPGGIMPMVVSHSFLDKLDPHVRQWISRRAELVSGVRLPNTAFKENANTEVVTDVLIFKRLDDSLMLGKQEVPDWLSTTDVNIENPKTGATEAIAVNSYFVKNPQNVLGIQSTASSAFRANEYTVEPNGDLEVQLTEWVNSLPEGIYVPLERSAVELEKSAVEIPDGVKEGSFFLANGVVYHRLRDALGERRSAAWQAPNQRAQERMVGMIEIRDALRRQMWLERSGEAHEVEIEAGRGKLNHLYDHFSGKFGFLNDPINRRLFLDDTESALIQALEFDYEKAITEAKAEEYGIEPRGARAKKADIFSRRVLFPPVEIANVETAKDALLHSLNMTGYVDMGYMERAYGKEASVIIEELGDLLYQDPIGGLVTADAYLSGDVKTKLTTAIKSAQVNAAFFRNVSALLAVIPKDKLPSEIFASIGGVWIPPAIYSAFAKEISGASVTYNYVASAGQWLSSNQGGMDYAKNSNEYGTGKMSALDILTHTMNSKGLEVKKRVEIDGHERYITDEEATEAVRQKGDKIRAHWDSWLWADGSRADTLTSLYNEKFNRIVERHYDGSHLSFPGMNPAITLLSHQKDGVWRGLQDRSMLADQVVGAGKTFELAAMAMEMRRLGIVKKPMFAVPNHLTLQWRSEFYRLYPGANVLAATPQDFEKENRERFFSKIVTGNWDAIIVGHSSLKKLEVPVEAANAIIQEQFDEMSEAILVMKQERGDRNIIRDMEKIMANLEAKIKKTISKGGEKDKVVDFADLGVDGLFVDEIHEFKNLFFSTQMNRVAGLGNPAGSGKAFDLFIKTQWLRNTFGPKAPLITATGTPVSNSLSEMFTMQRYMQYNELKENNLHMFDAWAKQYGDVQTVYEVAPSGTGYRLSQRFAKFKNLGSLMGSYRSFADVITLDDLKAQELAQGKVFPVPKLVGGKPLNVVAKRSELQEKFFGVPEIVRHDETGEIVFEVDLNKPISIKQSKDDSKWILEAGHKTKGFETQEEAAYALAVQATSPLMKIDANSIVGQFDNLRELTRQTKGKINALSLTGLANKAGLDYRIINAQAEDFADSKINLAVREMLESYKEWEADKGVQLAFCDLSVPLSAKAKMASKEKRVYVRDDKGEITHKKGTLHVPKDYEGLPYYLVAEGKGTTRSFTMYDPVTGAVLKEGFDSKQHAHSFVSEFVEKEGGQERWLDMRERMRPIEPDEIDDYKNHRSLDNDGDAADFEITAQDIEGATGVSAFSVYDDMKAKLVAAGVPANQIEFIHDHDTPQAKDALFKRTNAGDVRFLFGSTPKMGAGTNVQKRLVALHHIDAPWRPSDLEQREGRIIRRGNMLYERDPAGFRVKVNRYATAQTYDTRRWQLLEHKAAGVDQLRNYNGDNEIDDVASEASNSADMKAAASGNPLILKETQLATEVKKLTSLGRAHLDGEYMVRSRMNSNRNYAEIFGPELIAEYQGFIEARDQAVELGKFQGRVLHTKDEVVNSLGRVAALILAGHDDKVTFVYRGLNFIFQKKFIGKDVNFTTPDNETHFMENLSPSGCATRMENFVAGLEGKVSGIQMRIAASAKEANNMESLLGKPFDRAADLANAIAEHGKVQRALMKANSTAAVKPEERAEFEAAVEGQKARLVAMGFGEAVREIEAGDEGVEVSFNNNPACSYVVSHAYGSTDWNGFYEVHRHHGDKMTVISEESDRDATMDIIHNDARDCGHELYSISGVDLFARAVPKDVQMFYKGTAVVDSGLHSGNIVANAGGFVSQKVDRVGKLVVHDKAVLSAAVDVGELVDIKYVGGQAEVMRKALVNEVGI